MTAPANYAEAHAFVRSVVKEAIETAPAAQALMQSLLRSCAISLFDMVDHIAMPENEAIARLGWMPEGAMWRAPHPLLPGITNQVRTQIGFRVEAIDDFLAAIESTSPIQGAKFAPCRMATFIARDEISFCAVERTGWTGSHPASPNARAVRNARIHYQIFRTRRRQFQSTERALAHTLRLAQAAAADLGPQWAGALFAKAEREYWQTRSSLVAMQHRRQRQAGVGWSTIANLTYASSRERLPTLVEILETLGYKHRADLVRQDSVECWGALRFDPPPGAPMIVVNFDLASSELASDVLAGAASPLTWHGRPGMWSALHGESILDAGLHGLAAHYDATGAMRLMANDAAHDDQFHAIAQRDSLIHCEHRAVNPCRTNTLEQLGYLSSHKAESYRLLGAGASYFSALPNCRVAPEKPASHFTPDIEIGPSAPEPDIPKRRHRLRRRVPSTRVPPGSAP